MPKVETHDRNDAVTAIVATLVIIAIVMLLFWRLTLPPSANRDGTLQFRFSPGASAFDVPNSDDVPPRIPPTQPDSTPQA